MWTGITRFGQSTWRGAQAAIEMWLPVSRSVTGGSRQPARRLRRLTYLLGDPSMNRKTVELLRELEIVAALEQNEVVVDDGCRRAPECRIEI